VSIPENFIEQDVGLKKVTRGNVPLFSDVAVDDEYDRVSPSPHLEMILISALDKEYESTSVIKSEPSEEKETPVPKLASNINDVLTVPFKMGATSKGIIDNDEETDAVKLVRLSPTGAISRAVKVNSLGCIASERCAFGERNVRNWRARTNALKSSGEANSSVEFARNCIEHDENVLAEIDDEADGVNNDALSTLSSFI
jgi:hypothetical protein